jgi:hypothetical protein
MVQSRLIRQGGRDALRGGPHRVSGSLATASEADIYFKGIASTIYRHGEEKFSN